ncbi:MAG: flagellar hook-basal body complex protein FliE [Phycisphaerae bacterium]|jgi:flagellar hook-basal body complex protein FliE|nr:flagellar hook-basal body complex protein FliE [Phycisphaerae bacterium]
MSDPLGLVNSIGRIQPTLTPPASAAGGGANATDFRDELMRQVGEVNRLQQDATVAAEDLLTGQRNDVEAVMLATQKADSAFRMLLAVRNKVMDAYDEVKQMRV